MAIQTTYKQLVSAIEDEHEIYLGCVKYIDYEKDWFPNANAFYPVMHKRIAFEHEREVRLVASPSKYREAVSEEPPYRILLPWNTVARVERIFVDPYAPEYFFEAVATVIDTIAPELRSRLMWSQMRAAPVF